MAKFADTQDGIDPLPSQAVLDPMCRLAMAALLQSLKDLASADPVKFTDALQFWLGDAGQWIESLPLECGELDEVQIFLTAIEGARNGRKSLTH